MSVVIFGGEKGGTGKSFVCSAFVDWLAARSGGASRSIIVCDADRSNPDVHRMFRNHENFRALTFDLRTTEGWVDLLNTVEQNKDAVLVLNLPSNIQDWVAKMGRMFAGGVTRGLRRPLSLVWTIDREKDCIALLSAAMHEIGDFCTSKIVVKNLKHGKSDSFETWETSKVRKRFADIGGVDVEFPELWSRIADVARGSKQGYEPIPFSLLQGQMGYAESYMLKEWLDQVSEIFKGLQEKLHV